MYVVLTDENGMPRLDDDGQPITTHVIAPDELQGRTFLQPQPDGSIRRGQIVKEVQDLERQSSHFARSPEMTSFNVSFDKEDVEDVIAYNDIMNYISQEANEEDGELWKLRCIIVHQVPSLTDTQITLAAHIQCNVVEWENGEKSYMSLWTKLAKRIQLS